MNAEIIPFGKYKGQPAEVLNQDPQYLNWLKQQPWFNEKFAHFNTLIVNNMGAPARTPEHNRLQNLFLEDEVCENLWNFYKKHLGINGFRTVTTLLNKTEIDAVEKHNQRAWFLRDRRQMDIERDNDSRYSGYLKIPSLRDIGYSKESTTDLIAPDPVYHSEQIKVNFKLIPAVFEQDGCDVLFAYSGYTQTFSLRIEVKPCIADDYPDMLRQMKKNRTEILVANEFIAQGATLEQVREVFKRSSKILLLFSEFNNPE